MIICRRTGFPLILTLLLLAPSASADDIPVTWTGGSGSWEDPAGWDFATPPAAATTPANDASDNFQISIDADPATNSSVLLGTDVTISSLDVSEGDSLDITGRLELQGDSINHGNIEIHTGGHLEAVGSDLAINNRGHMHIRGPGTSAYMGVRNNGDLEVSDGASVDFTRYSGGLDARLTLRNTQVTVGVASTSAGGGTFVLEDASISWAALRQVSGRIEGSGRWDQPSQLQFLRATAAPGTRSSPGVLEFGGSIQLSSIDRLEFDVFGPTPAEYDRLISMGTVSHLGHTQVDFGGGYTPAAGDRFDLLRAESIFAPLEDFVAPSFSGTNRYFLLEIDDGASEDTLTAEVAEMTTASWNGGTGAYSDGSFWSFDRATPAEVPNNAEAEFFNVEIDTGAANSLVVLDQETTVQRARVGAAGTLVIGSAGHLEVMAPGGHEAGIVESDGVVRIAGSQLTADTNLDLTGSGLISLGAGGSDPNISVRSEISGPQRGLRIGKDLTLAGGGLVTVDGFILNLGLVEPRGAAPLELDASVFNQGTIRTTEDSELVVRFLSNEGHVHVEAGAKITAADGIPSAPATREFINTGSVQVDVGGLVDWMPEGFFIGGPRVSNLGDFRLDGTINGLVQNFADLEVSSGATLGGLGQSSTFVGNARFDATDAVARVAGTVGGLSLNQGRVILDHGIVSANFSMREEGRLEGSGRITGGDGRFRSATFGGTIAPGEDGIGEIDFVNDLTLGAPTNLEFDIGDQQRDVIQVLGKTFLSGSVVLQALDGHEPSLGDSYDVLIAKAIQDDGYELIAPTLADGLRWRSAIVHTARASMLRVFVTPEPSTGLLLAVGLLLGVSGARRERLR